MASQNKASKDPLALRTVRFAFGILDRTIPPLANRWGFKLFTTPYRYPLPQRERLVKESAEHFDIQYDGKKLQAYTWGTGPIVLFVHGWAGRGLQVSELVQPLVNSGYQVVTFDAQAHGKSEGKTTNLVLMTGALQALCNKLGPIHTIVGHSFGGTIGLYGIKNGLDAQNLVTISTPSVGQGIIDEFLRRINGSASVGQYLRKRVLNLTGQSFDEFTAETSARYISKELPVLIIHDNDDKEAPIYHADALKTVLPHGKTFYTKDLGHTRILRDQKVIERVVTFVKNHPTTTEIAV